MSWDDCSTNDEGYGKIPELSDMQHYLLRKARAAREEGGLGAITLTKEETPAAMGLQQRRMVRTERAMKGHYLARSQKAVPGSKRRMWLTTTGLAVVERLPEGTTTKPARENEHPTARAQRELAEAVLAWAKTSRASASHKLARLARTALDAMEDE